ncbi:MAG: hypothetical protein UIG59_06480 [Acutalibacteraceae bacterium]|nr:hypothetical protein [Acutalibacteraceae bacterium]
MKVFRRILLLMAFCLMVFVMAGCGATVSTDMTVDKDFNGSRVITLEISSDDLGDVDGGITGLETVITENIPDGMSYTISDATDGKNIVFTIEFKGLTDYRNKVNAIINAGITEEEKAQGDALTPEITYERHDSYFKKGVKFEENFDSVDLLDWFREGLRKAAIISESESNWYENGDHFITIEGVQHEVYGDFEVDTQEKNCIDDCEISTQLLLDNTIIRTIEFSAYKDTIDSLAAAGCKLEDYLKNLATDGIEFTSKTDESSNAVYTFVITAANPQELVEKTNKVLQSKTNVFSFESVLDKENIGMAKVTVSELVDASFYVDYDSDNVYSQLLIYNNAIPTGANCGNSEISFDLKHGGIFYSAQPTLTYTFKLDWQIQFENITFDIEPAGKDKIKVTLDCKHGDALSDEMKQSAIDRIVSFFKDEKNYKTSDDGVVITFSGNVAEVEKQINQLVCAAAGKDYTEDETSYFSVEKKEFKTKSLFTSGAAFYVDYDFDPLISNTNMKVKEKDNLFGSKQFVGGFKNDEDKTALVSCGDVNVYVTNLNYLAVVLAFLCFAAVVFGAVMLLRSIKPLKEYAAHKKQGTAVSSELDSEASDFENTADQAYDGAEDNTATVSDTLADEETVSESTNISYDEEDIL